MVDVLLAFPQLVFALLLVSIIGPKLWLVILAVGLSHAPQVARVMRAATLDVSERDFVKATELIGVKRRRIMAEEILPNLISPLMVEIGLRLTYSIVIIAGLSFLGVIPIRITTAFGSGIAGVPGKTPDADVSVTPSGAISESEMGSL